MACGDGDCVLVEHGGDWVGSWLIKAPFSDDEEDNHEDTNLES